MIIVLTVIGYIIGEAFLDMSLSQLHKENVQIVSTTLSGPFTSILTFALSIGLIPLLYLVIDKFVKLRSLNQIITTLGIILVCGILTWQLRIFQLNNQFQGLSKTELGKDYQNSMDLQHLQFGKYLLIEFIIGGILSTVIFKVRNKSKTE